MANNSELENSGITSQQILSASAAWDGSPFPLYPAGTPVISIIRYTFPPHSVTNAHFHEVINCGVVLSGKLTIVKEDGSERVFHAGEGIAEAVGTVHHGENREDEVAVVIMFYAGNSADALSTPVR